MPADVVTSVNVTSAVPGVPAIAAAKTHKAPAPRNTFTQLLQTLLGVTCGFPCAAPIRRGEPGYCYLTTERARIAVRIEMNDSSPMSSVATSVPGRSRRDPMILWKAYVGTVLVVWVVIAFGFHYWREIIHHWQMAVVMIPGSLVAGSTAMGGGTVAFPILVLVLHQPPANARNFGLLIQGLGMSSAMFFMIGRKIRLPFRFLFGTTLGAPIGLLLGTFLVGPHVQNSITKLLFSCLWMSFGLLILLGNAELRGLQGAAPPNTANTQRVGLLVGVMGGLIIGIIGVGVELCVYCVLVLIYRADLRIAIPTAVCAAALASAEGVALHRWLEEERSGSSQVSRCAWPRSCCSLSTGLASAAKNCDSRIPPPVPANEKS